MRKVKDEIIFKEFPKRNKKRINNKSLITILLICLIILMLYISSVDNKKLLDYKELKYKQNRKIIIFF